MKIKTLLVTLIVGFSAVTVCFTADTKLEKALRDADAEWSKAAASKDVDKTVSYYADDTIVMPPNDAMANTKAAIRKIWNDLLTSPGATISWKATKVEVSKSGDIGFVAGTYELTMNDASGKPMNDRGKYREVWEKQTDGNWKCRADMWNSDLAATATASPEKK